MQKVDRLFGNPKLRAESKIFMNAELIHSDAFSPDEKISLLSFYKLNIYKKYLIDNSIKFPGFEDHLYIIEEYLEIL